MIDVVVRPPIHLGPVSSKAVSPAHCPHYEVSMRSMRRHRGRVQRNAANAARYTVRSRDPPELPMSGIEYYRGARRVRNLVCSTSRRSPEKRTRRVNSTCADAPVDTISSTTSERHLFGTVSRTSWAPLPEGATSDFRPVPDGPAAVCLFDRAPAAKVRRRSAAREGGQRSEPIRKYFPGHTERAR